jgi:hypothetical protein
MDKNTKTKRVMKPYTIYNKEIVARLVLKYGLTKQFIYASLRGDRQSLTSEAICKDYNKAFAIMTENIKNL